VAPEATVAIRATKEADMSIAKVIEIIAEGPTIEEAIRAGVEKAGKSVHGIKHLYVDGIQALIDDNKVTTYRINAKVTFVVD
jgi:flavin-binding protein dodecin